MDLLLNLKGKKINFIVEKLSTQSDKKLKKKIIFKIKKKKKKLK